MTSRNGTDIFSIPRAHSARICARATSPGSVWIIQCTITATVCHCEDVHQELWSVDSDALCSSKSDASRSCSANILAKYIDTSTMCTTIFRGTKLLHPDCPLFAFYSICLGNVIWIQFILIAKLIKHSIQQSTRIVYLLALTFVVCPCTRYSSIFTQQHEFQFQKKRIVFEPIKFRHEHKQQRWFARGGRRQFFLQVLRKRVDQCKFVRTIVAQDRMRQKSFDTGLEWQKWHQSQQWPITWQSTLPACGQNQIQRLDHHTQK